MKTRQGVARRLMVLTVVGTSSVLGMTAGLAFGLHQDAGQPTGQPDNRAQTGTGATTTAPASKSLASSSQSLLELVASFGGEKAFTRPWRDSVMGFSQSSRVLEVLIAGGQDVKKGQLLVRGEDEEEEARLVLQKMRAGSTLSVDKANKSVELATLQKDRYFEAAAKGGTAQTEVDKARLDYEASIIDRDTAKLNQDQEVIAVRLAQARLDRVHIVAPFDGSVDVVNVDVGQQVSENDKVLRLVDTSKLWADVGVPTGQTIELNLAVGGKAWALMNLPGDVKVFEGTIIEVSPVADPSSNTRRVRIEIPNPSKLVAGVTTWVRFTEPGGEWTSRIVRPASAAAAAPAPSVAEGSSGSTPKEPQSR